MNKPLEYLVICDMSERPFWTRLRIAAHVLLGGKVETLSRIDKEMLGEMNAKLNSR